MLAVAVERSPLDLGLAVFTPVKLDLLPVMLNRQSTTLEARWQTNNK